MPCRTIVLAHGVAETEGNAALGRGVACSGLGQQHCVDNVNDAIRTLDVGSDDLGGVNGHAVGAVNMDRRAATVAGSMTLPTTSAAMTLPGMT